MDKAQCEPIPINRWDIRERSAKDQLICMSSTMENKMSINQVSGLHQYSQRPMLEADFQVQQLFSLKEFYKRKRGTHFKIS